MDPTVDAGEGVLGDPKAGSAYAGSGAASRRLTHAPVGTAGVAVPARAVTGDDLPLTA
ncbi:MULTISPECIES: hypothetical protein [Cupriavidus]